MNCSYATTCAICESRSLVVIQGETGIRVFMLAGGNATRLFPYSDIHEKSMLPIAGKPIIRIIIERLLKSRICTPDEVTICCLGRHIQNFQHEFRDVPGIKYSPKVEAIGTASHYYYAAEIEQRIPQDEYVMVHYSDCLTDLDYAKFVGELDFYKTANGIIYVTKNVRHEYSEVQLQYGNASAGQVEDGTFPVGMFIEKPKMAYHTWTGVAMFWHRAIKKVVGDRILGHRVDFGHDIIPAILSRMGDLYAYQSDDAWFDCGTAHNYRKLRDMADRGDIFV